MNLGRLRQRTLVSAFLAVIGACTASTTAPEFSLLYTPAARHHGPDRNPIIAIPGILGSKLRDPRTGELAWGAFEAGAADPTSPMGARQIALPIGALQALVDLRDDIVPSGVLDKVHIQLGIVALDIQAYAGILATLGAGGYRDQSLGLGGDVDYGNDHFTCFQFDYDWRRDNVENARRLRDFIDEKRSYVQAQYKSRYGIDNADVRFDIAAHSMGALLTRYFLMYGGADLPTDGSLPPVTWQGAEHVERVIMIGPPNAGSSEALLELIHGRKFALLLPFYPPAVLGTFPSMYELLPRNRHRPVLWDGDASRPVADITDSGLWERNGWGLADPKQADVLKTLLPNEPDPAVRRDTALKFQRRALLRAREFQAALDQPAQVPAGLDLFLVAGDSIDTIAQLSVNSADGAVSVHSRAPGDGTVLRTSALLDERAGDTYRPMVDTPIAFRQVLFLPDEHLALTRSTIFRDNVLFWLLEDKRWH